MIYQNTDLKNAFKEYLTIKYNAHKNPPVLYVVQVGEDAVSAKYVAMKQKMAQSLGSELVWKTFPSGAQEREVKEEVKAIPSKDGLIYQLPIPEKFQGLVATIRPELDVDLLGNNFAAMEKQGILPPTIGAIDLLLKAMCEPNKDINIEELLTSTLSLRGVTVGVVGQGVLVGGPVVRYLLAREATIVSVNEYTKQAQELISTCEVVICGAGKPGLITKAWLKKDAIVIDAATSESGQGLRGDVDLEKIWEGNIVSTTPRGVGGLTVLYLFYNLLRLYKS